MKSLCTRHGLGLLLSFSAAIPVLAQSGGPVATTTKTVETKVETPTGTTTTQTTTTTRGKIVDTGKEAGRIASQPARDVGAQKVTIPVPVQQAAAAPYSLKDSPVALS